MQNVVSSFFFLDGVLFLIQIIALVGMSFNVYLVSGTTQKVMEFVLAVSCSTKFRSIFYSKLAQV